MDGACWDTRMMSDTIGKERRGIYRQYLLPRGIIIAEISRQRIPILQLVETFICSAFVAIYGDYISALML